MPVLDKLKEMFISDKSRSSNTTQVKETLAPHDKTTSAVPPGTETAKPSAASNLSDLSKDNGAAFDAAKVKVIFVLGGPGAGKGTQCERLVRDYGFKHLSAGNLLRGEQNREGSTYGEMIKEHIRQGQILPMEVTVKLLENAMHDALKSPPTFPSESPLSHEWTHGKGRFLIDGFPRKMDQALKFDESVCKSSFVLFISTTEEVMLSRLLERGKTSGRDDDNKESIVKRFRTFVETSMPVVDYYRERGAVEEVDSSPSVDEVYATVQQVMEERLGTASTASTTNETSAPAFVPVPVSSATTASEGHSAQAPVLAPAI